MPLELHAYYANCMTQCKQIMDVMSYIKQTYAKGGYTNYVNIFSHMVHT